MCKRHHLITGEVCKSRPGAVYFSLSSVHLRVAQGSAIESVSHRQAKARLSHFLSLFYPFPARDLVFTCSSYLFSDQCNTVQCYILNDVMMASGAESTALETHEPYCNVISFCQSKSFCKSQAFARCSVLSNILFANQREKESQKTYFHFLSEMSPCI